MIPPEATVLTAENVKVGLSAEFEREIDEEDILSFAHNSGDYNPLHVDSKYARTTNFHNRIVHGAFQVALASAMLGMRLPGRNVLLGAVNGRFMSPLYFPSRVRVRGEITSWHPPSLSGNLKVIIQEVATHIPTAEVSLNFTFHQDHQERAHLPSPDQKPQELSGRKIILVTGAAGGIGAALVSAITKKHFVLGMTNRVSLDEGLTAAGNVNELQADISSPGLEERVKAALGNNTLYGIVHAAWPGAPHGGLLGTPDDIIEHQLSFGTTHIIRLARILVSCASSEGGRFVALGSLQGSQKPVSTLSTYSLGKAALEHTVKLLAPELARKKITINAVCPSFVPVGMHKQSNDLQVMKETARVPMGRLCQPDDIASMVEYLLSPQASFVSGQIMSLSGAQL
jgi:NAD(P)-dependent dehydrogenase (short-subunit alcohol dehydrogenase family)/acyl dehydratase